MYFFFNCHEVRHLWKLAVMGMGMNFTHTLFSKAPGCFFDIAPCHHYDQMLLASTAFTFCTSGVVSLHSLRQLQSLMHLFHIDHCLGLCPSRVSPKHGPPRPCLLLLWHIPLCSPVLAQESHTHPPISMNKYLQLLYTLSDAWSYAGNVVISHTSLHLLLNEVHIFIWL